MDEKLLIVEDEFIVANDLTIILENAGYTVCGTADTVESARAAVEKFQPTWVLLDILLQDDAMGTELAPFLQERGIGFIYVSANTNQRILETAKATKPYGFIVKPFREKDLLIMLEIARGTRESNMLFSAQRESVLQQHLRELSETDAPRDEKCLKVPGSFQSLIPFDLLCYQYQSSDGSITESGAFYRIGFDEYQRIPASEAESLTGLRSLLPANRPNQKSADIKAVSGTDFIMLTEDSPAKDKLVQQYRLNASLQFSKVTGEGVVSLSFNSKNSDAFDYSHISMLRKTERAVFNLFRHLAHCVDTVQPKTLRRASRIQLPDILPASPKFEGIYGNSAALLHVLDNIEMVAPTSVSALILGESGTGKEKVAHNIHKLSLRSSGPFVTVNCAAMPAELIESELFGHEKGAFTGAVEKRIGKFEMANGGTIFLDEIGEMPLESQVKLLRVLQEKQFEHIGSSKTVKVDVRIVAATNRNLEKEVAEGRFRLDLFYRLNVYPIQLPPLRERKEDIPTLSNYFLHKSAAGMGRSEVPELSAAAIKQLSAYNWPGNIRELEHLIARTLIKTRQNVIENIELPAIQPQQVIAGAVNSYGAPKTLEQIEAEHILSVLQTCKGKVFGSGGAAEILGLPPSTLTSRMKKLGIKKESYHNR